MSVCPPPSPVGHDTQRHYDKVRAFDPAHKVQVRQEGDGLQRLAQALGGEDREAGGGQA